MNASRMTVRWETRPRRPGKSTETALGRLEASIDDPLDKPMARRGFPRLFQDLRAKRDSKLTYLTAWIASFVRVPCR